MNAYMNELDFELHLETEKLFSMIFKKNLFGS